jgi:hypothetical protein
MGAHALRTIGTAATYLAALPSVIFTANAFRG